MMHSIKSLTVALSVAAVLAIACVVPKAPLADDQRAQSGRDIVVVLHGLGRSISAMRQLAGRLDEAGYRAVRIGYESLQQTPEEILADISRQIEACCIGKSPNLHFVGHSLGGLLIRAYLSDHKPDNRGHVVVIGTPNNGNEVVDSLRHNWWFDLLGPMARALGTDDDSFPKTIGSPDYPLGVIAGRKAGTSNEKYLPGEDDGLVSIASTRIDGMSDFVIVDAGHSALRNDADVARHVVKFLRTGRFDKNGGPRLR